MTELNTVRAGGAAVFFEALAFAGVLGAVLAFAGTIRSSYVLVWVWCKPFVRSRQC